MTHLFANNKLLIIGGLGILVALGVWWGLPSDTPSGSLITPQGDGSLIPAERNVVDTLLTLRAVSLNGTIFLDPSFKLLKDFGKEITPEPVGRANPFSPIGASGAIGGTESVPSPTP